ncbi:mediator of RNA polymerase II transcription subunit 2-like [Scaptodrosophila lebanonensis]|uniref:Mediator of RNA polymerase II transcription subunit 2-like n=1 Tax=Drosophila lebanonensis TaxID=7225 RepID=A0A6J2U478_DROLE|nr:mediator of RNA polymerase II transcription subunit 2-like [Scaptodrosophila lebanonensis]
MLRTPLCAKLCFNMELQQMHAKCRLKQQQQQEQQQKHQHPQQQLHRQAAEEAATTTIKTATPMARN